VIGDRMNLSRRACRDASEVLETADTDVRPLFSLAIGVQTSASEAICVLCSVFCVLNVFN